MKNIISFAVLLIMSARLFAQAPEKISYQAIVRNASNALVSSTPIGMQISILQGSATGSSVYVEKQNPTTNANGLVSVEIGTGLLISGNFADINWANGPFFIKTEIDPLGGSNYSISGTSELLSVPYALYAKSAANGLQDGTAAGQMMYWNGKSWVTIPPGIEHQILSFCGGIPTWGPCLDTITSLDCRAAINAGNLIEGISSSAVSTSIPYLGGNGGPYTVQSVTSTGVTGLTANLAAGKLAIGAGNINYTISGIPISSGIAKFNITLGGQTCILEIRVLNSYSQYPVGTVFCAAGPTVIKNVTNPTTGKIWMDRNLGASRAATRLFDEDAFGDLYQWGREADGHQCRNSTTTTTLSSTDQPGHANFIVTSVSPYNWRNPQNTNLWQGENGINNPCPKTYRLPTNAELVAELFSWKSKDVIGAFASPLKPPVSDVRLHDGTFYAYGGYWSSSVNGLNAWVLNLYIDYVTVTENFHLADGVSVRCIKD